MSPKNGHVNMMTDAIIANLPLDGVRSVMRGVLAAHPGFTPVFEELTRSYLYETASRYEKQVTTQQADGTFNTTPAFADLRQRICCMVGCGLCYQALPLLRDIVNQIASLDSDRFSGALKAQIAAVDGDIIQTLTAIQKTLFVPSGTRDLSESEAQPLQELLQSLLTCREAWESNGQTFLLQRGLDATAQLLGPLSKALYTPKAASIKPPSELPPSTINETFALDGISLPRIFTGLWQLSSPAWGSAPREKMIEHFSNHVQRGFTAFDMADHYGDAEIIFGGYRSASAYSDSIFAATKYCVFHPMEVSEEAIRANVDQRCQRLSTENLDLLQFHWQFYGDDQYIKALQYLQADQRIKHLGLCNFDTEHMQRVVDSGIKIVTNQVQFSLIDPRPTMKMAEFCKKHNIKLLTYGTLCGGLLAEKWIGQEPPDLYSDEATPSLRKYYTMIRSWGGWPLFQELLRALHSIAQKHGVTVSNVATRWVLDFPYVGAVIVGARMGVSEQSAVNLGSLGWTLDGEDRARIDSILQRSLRKEMFESMGDCGGEYR